MDLSFLWQEALILVVGAALKWGYDYFVHRRRQAPLRCLFGSGALREDGLVVQVSQFDPLCFDDFDEAAETTWMRKVAPRASGHISINAGARDESGDKVPVYSKALLVEEFEAFTLLSGMFASRGARTSPRLADAASSIGQLDVRASVVALGVSPSALEFLSSPMNSRIEVQQRGPTLDGFELRVRTEEGSRVHRVSKTSGVGCVCRFPHPVHDDLAVVLIFGDRAETTLAMAKWLHANVDRLTESGDCDELTVVAEVGGPAWSDRHVVHLVRNDVVEIDDRTSRIAHG